LNDYLKEDKMGWEYSTSGEKRNSCRVLRGTPEGKRSVARTKRGWDNNNKIDL
jgi:hypothetical protein